MEYLKRFYFIPWTIWCGLSFLSLNVLFFPFIYIFLLTGNKTLYRWTHHIPTIIGRISLVLWGVRVKVSGREHFDPNTQYIFVGNHRSMLDALLSGGLIYNPKKFIGKAEILRWPFLGYMLGKLYIPVKREDKKSRKWSMEQLLLKMKEGYSMIMFSEGKTNTTAEPLLPFKDGAYNLACQMQIPIVPFVIYGAEKIWSRKVFLIRPGVVYMSFLPMQEPLGFNEDNVEQLKKRVFNSMLSTYSQLEESF